MDPILLDTPVLAGARHGNRIAHGAFVRIENVVKRFGSSTAVDNVCLNIGKNELFALLEAAFDLGATPLAAFWRITLPLSKKGIIAGSLLVFIPAVGENVIPELLGGANMLMLGHVMLCLSFVAVIVQSRVRELDRSIEEAALDLLFYPIRQVTVKDPYRRD